MPDIHIADISEFQANIDAPTYLKENQCLISRVHNGNRPDNMMPGRRDYLRGQTFTGLGWYQYLVASRDPADQAHDFINTVGGLRSNEWPILDLEEGSGDQTARAAEWFGVVDKWAGFPAMLYSGDSFMTDQLGGSAHWTGRPVWIAAYAPAEPSQAHTLWQYSESASFAGIAGGGCDASVHHDTASEFIKAVRGGRAPTPAPTPAPSPSPKAPPFPYPASDYLGLPSSDPHCHSGHFGGVDTQNVRTWQQQMAHRGWAINVDGDFGSESDSVAKQFQQQERLAADGRVGPQTWSASWTAPVT